MMFLLVGLASALESASVFLMSDVAGSVTAFDTAGRLKWSLDTGRPFVSSFYSEDALDGSEAVFFPTSEGELLTFEDSQFRLGAMNIAQFVDACPLISDKGLYYVGEKKTRAYSVETTSGRVVAYYADLISAQLQPPSGSVVLISLVDYIIQALRMEDMKVYWNLTYTQVKPGPSDSILYYESFEVRKAIESFGISGQLVRIESEASSGLVPSYSKTKVRIKSLDHFALYAELLTDNFVVEADSRVFPLYVDRSLLALEGPSAVAENNTDFRSIVLITLLIVLIASTRYKSKPKPPIQMSDQEVLTDPVVEAVPARKQPKLYSHGVGQLTVFTDKVLGTGSNGTTVFEGTWQERPVAVKRMLKQLSHFARREMKLLLKTDSHPAVVTFYAWEEDDTFVYLAMERCVGSLSLIVDLANPKKQRAVEAKLPAVPPKLQILEQAAQGLAYLHSLNIVHRDIKPMNILIDQFGNAKIADMASGKSLRHDKASFGTHDHGSFGWQPAEVLRKSRRTMAVDVFSLGCTFYYTLCDGQHPFGQRMQRDSNILAGKFDLSNISPLAFHLISRMIALDPVERPDIRRVVSHPLFWSAEKKLAFMQDLSDWLEVNEDMDGAFEAACSEVLTSKWRTILDPEFAENIDRYRKYKTDSVKDLLRVIRNKRHHYAELPPEVKRIVGHVPEGYCAYFEGKFPTFLTACYDFVATLHGHTLHSNYFT